MMPPLSRSPQANGYNASMMPLLSRSPQANGYNAIEKREQRNIGLLSGRWRGRVRKAHA
jgi:hypothetical protein